MAIKLLTPATSEPIKLEDVKSFLRLNTAEEDPLISSWITAARQYLEQTTGIQILPATYAYYLDAFPYQYPQFALARAWTPYPDMLYLGPNVAPYRGIRLPFPPLRQVNSITYIDLDGVTRTWDPSQYIVDAITIPGRITPIYSKFFPIARWVPNSVTIQFQAGYDAPPEAVKQFIRLLVAHWYSNRSTVGASLAELPLACQALALQLDPGSYFVNI